MATNLARLRILETVTRGRVETYHAIDPDTDQHVLLHYGDAALFDIADDLGNDVIDWGDSADRHYLITRNRPEYRDLNPRIKPWPDPDIALRNAGRWTSPASLTPEPSRNHIPQIAAINMNDNDKPKDNTSSSEPGEFTRMFRAATPAAERPQATPETEASTSEPGEFTRMFQLGSGFADQHRSTMPTEAAVPAKDPSAHAAETTTDLRTPATPTPLSPEQLVASPLPAPSTAESESFSDQPKPEFTRIFRRTPQPQRPNRTPSATPSPAPVEASPDVTAPFKSATPQVNATPLVAPPPLPVPEALVQPPPQKEPETTSRPGEFTSLFSTPTPAPVDSPRPPKRDGNFDRQSVSEPQGFTEMFRQPTAEPLPPAPKPSQPPPQPAQPSQPGAFTDFFRKAPPPPPAAAPPPAPKGSDFTNFFEDPLRGASKPVDWNAVANQPAPAPAAKPPGDFTRMFGRSGTGAEPAKPAPPQFGGREGATAIFQVGANKPGPADARSQIDDFGRLFANSPQAQAPVPPAPQAAPPAQSAATPLSGKLPKAPPVVLLIALILLVVLLAAAAFYYFVIRK